MVTKRAYCRKVVQIAAPSRRAQAGRPLPQDCSRRDAARGGFIGGFPMRPLPDFVTFTPRTAPAAATCSMAGAASPPLWLRRDGRPRARVHGTLREEKRERRGDPRQLYNFQDRGERDVALRPEMTPTLARMVIAKERAYRKPMKWFQHVELLPLRAPAEGTPARVHPVQRRPHRRRLDRRGRGVRRAHDRPPARVRLHEGRLRHPPQRPPGVARFPHRARRGPTRKPCSRSSTRSSASPRSR